MFGISKKKETEKAEKPINKGAEGGSDDEIQFDFEEDDKLPFDDDHDFVEGDFDEEEIEEGGLRGALSQRKVILLGCLLLLVAGGGGYYYLNSSPDLPPPAPAPVKTKVVVNTVAPAPVVAAAPAKPASPAPVVAAAPAKPASPAAVAKVAAVVATPAVKSEVAVSATPQPFTLEAGVFVNVDNQRAIEKKIQRLGYTPKVQTTYSMVPMTRLLLGIYDPEAAAARRKELAADVPDLFSIKDGDKVALYAGSYLSVNLARSFADKLYKRGILADEETISMRMALKKISYGSFTTREEAEKAAKKAKTAGLSVQVVKR